MGKEALKGLKIIARGMEHTVYEPISGQQKTVFKVPTLVDYLSMWGKDQATVLYNELLGARELVKDTNVKIPGTRIYPTRNRNILGKLTGGYIIEQRYIEEDGSIPNIPAYLVSQRLSILVDDLIPGKENFRSNGGTVYWLDPTKGRTTRFLESKKWIKLETYRKIRRKLSPLIRLIVQKRK